MNPPQYPAQQYSAAQQHPALSARTGPPPVVWAQPPAAQPTVVQPKAPGRHGSGWIAALAALVVLAGLGVVGWHYWPRGSGGGGTPDGHNSSSPTGRGDPDLPDMLYDGTSPVLHTRDGNRVPLPAGGAVKGVIGVPSGWMVSRDAGGGTFVAQYLDRNGALVKQSGSITGYYVNAAGTRVALATTDQQVLVWDLDKSAFPSYTTAVSGGAKPIGMIGDNVLIRVGGGDSYDYWAPAQGNYKQTPSTTALIPLGGRAQDGKLVGITKPDGCLSLFDVENGFTPTGKPLCDPNLTLTRVASTILPVLSPDGRFLVVRRGGDTVAVDVDAALAGNGNAFHRLDLGADIESVAWGRSVLYAKTTAGRYLRCQLTDGACATIDVPADSGGLTPTKPVVRFGL